MLRTDETKLLRDVYGDSVDKIVQGNTSNIVFLKSTDDSMLDTLEKMSGKTHRAYKNSKTVTRDMEKLVLPNEGKVSYTMQVQEIPVISYNDSATCSVIRIFIRIFPKDGGAEIFCAELINRRAE